MLQYTGGTTGLPKGAMLTHGNLSAACAQYWETVSGTPPVLVEGGERVLAVLPPFHIYALTVNMLFGMRGAAEVILHARFDIEAVLRDLTAKKVTSFPGVPTMFTALLAHPDVGKHDLRSLKFCGSGGAPLPVEVAQRFVQLTGCQLSEGWGMTETSPTGTFTPVHGKRKAGSCGIPMPRIVIRMLDLDDPSRYVPLGERGEMCIKGPNVMKGYWNNPEATAEATTFDGFMRTGDVAIDGRGRLRLHRRPHQGHDPVQRLQRLSAQHRGGDLRAPGGRRGDRDRHRRRLPRPVAEGVRQAEARRRALHARRIEGVPQGAARQARDGAGARHPRRPAEDAGRQAVEEGTGRREEERKR